MIVLNEKRFAENENEFLDSLFVSKTTCVGHAKRNKKSITIMDSKKNKVGVINRHGVLVKATKVDGGWWYSYGDIDIIGAYDSYMKSTEEPRALIAAL